MVARDIALVRLTGAPVHFLHLSTAGSVELVRRAKAEGLPVTAEAAPHHMLLTHALVAGYDPVFKVNPPLRTDEDVAAVIAGLCDGTIDAIATDHAPHAPEAKDAPVRPGPSGHARAADGAAHRLAGALAASRPRADLRPAERAARRHRRADGDRRPPRRAQRAGRPARGGGHGQPLRLRPRGEHSGRPDPLASRSRNTPYAGRTFAGAVRHTVLRGEPVVIDAEAQR